MGWPVLGKQPAGLDLLGGGLWEAEVALVYLPAAYFQPSQAKRRFPVIELFHGFPGNPVNWFRELHLAEVLDAEIASGRMPAVIAVVPMDYDRGRDGECVNAVRGQQDETYLAVDVPADIRHDFRALDTPRGWATVGYSTGGFCAVNIALHHPDRYAAAASISGYYSAIVDGTTGDLYRRNAAARRWNSPQWLVTHRRVTVPLYLVASQGDPQAMQAMRTMGRAARNRLPLVTVTLPGGGHNFHVWYAADAPPAMSDRRGPRRPATGSSHDHTSTHHPPRENRSGRLVSSRCSGRLAAARPSQTRPGCPRSCPS